jgi:hypothetical protein
MADLPDRTRRFSNHRKWREFIAAVHERAALPRAAAPAADRAANWLHDLEGGGRSSMRRMEA